MTDSPPFPDWVTSGAQPINGFDLLGLRLPVQRIGLSILSGITTATPTIRYLSLRSWIIHSYERNGRPSNVKAIDEFASRIETAVVLGNLLVDRQTPGLVGSNEANDLLNQNGDPIALDRLVKQLAFSTYAGPSEQVGIGFVADDGMPTITRERGLPLAVCAGRALEETKFGRLIEEGQLPNVLSRVDLLEVGQAFSLQAVPDSERRLLVECLLPTEPKQFRNVSEIKRVATYALLMECARTKGALPTEPDLFELAIAVENSAPHLQLEVDGWLCYLVRDTIAVAHEAALAAILKQLEVLAKPGDYVDDTLVIRETLRNTEALNEPLRSLGLLERSEHFDSLTFGELERRIVASLNAEPGSRGLRRWTGAINELRLIKLALPGGIGCLSLLPVVWILARERTASAIDAARLSGAPLYFGGDTHRIGLRDVVIPSLSRWVAQQYRLSDVIAELAALTMAQHLRMAWSRLAQDTRKDVALVLTDGPRWQFRREYGNGRTLSRLRQSLGWLQQLELIGGSGLTPEGEEVLARAHATVRLREATAA